MAYKFQNGEAILSGSLIQEGKIEIDTGFAFEMHDLEVIDSSRNLKNIVDIDASGDLTVATITGPSPFSVDATGNVIADSFKTDSNEFVVSTAGLITAMGLNNSAQGITNAGAVAGVSTLDASGLASLDGGINVADAMTVSAAGAVSGSGTLAVGGDTTIQGDVSPLTDGAYDLGSSTKEWKDLYIDGVAYVDELRADLLGAALDANSQAITNINVDSGAIDGATVGASSQASGKFTTLSASSTLQAAGAVSGYGNADFGGSVTAGSSFIIGSADLNEADMEKLDGITNGTVAANKAVVVDGNLDADGFRSITASANVVANKLFGDGAGITNINVGNLDAFGSDTQVQYNNNGEFSANAGFVYDGSGSVSVTSALKAEGNLSGGANLTLHGNVITDGYVTIDGEGSSIAAADGAIADGDYVYFIDANDSFSLKKETLADLAAFQAGTGLAAANSVFNIDLNELGVSAIDVSADSFAFIDANDGNGTRKESIADLVTAMAGNGLGSTSGVLKVEVSSNGGVAIASDELVVSSSATDAQSYGSSCEVLIFDATGRIARESATDFGTYLAGTGLESTTGTLALDLAELSDAAVASGDKFAFVDATDDSSKLESIDDIATLFAGTGLAAASAVLSLDLNELSALGSAGVVAGDQLAFVDATDDSTKKVTMANFLGSIAGAGISVSSGKLITDGGAVTLAASGVALSEGYNYCADISGAQSSISCPLPASPTVGDVVHLKAGSLASGKTVAATVQGSHFIDGDLSSITLESSHAAASLVYVADDAWRLV